jgi:hypothetical protein
MGGGNLVLTVCCFLWGDWPHAEMYVDRLRRGVARHLSLPHRFEVITAAPDLPRNLRKMWLYAPENGLSGRVLCLDLDTVVIGSLDDIGGYVGQFCVLEDLWQPGLCGGGVTAFEAGDPVLQERLWQPIVDNLGEVMSVCGGAERHWFRAQMPDADFWQRFYPGQIVDAKPKATRQIIEAVPGNGRLVCFHGRPRPHEVERDWLTEHWQ